MNRNDLLRLLEAGEPIPAKFRVRDASTAEFTAANPVLDPGELAADPATGQVWVGDGVTSFVNLSSPTARFEASRPTIPVREFGPPGVVGNGGDDTEAIQEAVDYAKSLHGGANLDFGGGIYRISDTIVSEAYVSWTSRWGNGGFTPGAAGPANIRWDGPADLPMVVVETDPNTNRIHWTSFSGLMLRSGTAKASHGLVFQGRCDLGVKLTDFQVASTNDHGVVFEDGGINIYIENVRFDACGKHAIKWVLNGQDNLAIRNWTVDNYRPDLPAGSGALLIDASSPPADTHMWLSVSDCKVELNSNMAVGEGIFRFNIDPAAAPSDVMSMVFDNVWATYPIAAPNNTGILISPPNDYQRISIRSSKLTVKGVPSYRTRIGGTEERHTDTVITPFGPDRVNSWSSSRRSSFEVFGDVNYTGRMFANGKALLPIYSILPTDTWWNTNPTTVYAGTRFVTTAGYASGDARREVIEATTTGTLGTLTGVTGTNAASSTTVVVNDASKLLADHYVTIGGVTKKITEINYGTNTLSFSNPWASAQTNAAVTFAAPSMRPLLQNVKVFAAPTVGTWSRGDVVWNGGAAVGSPMGWMCTGGGTPGTWVAMPNL